MHVCLFLFIVLLYSRYFRKPVICPGLCHFFCFVHSFISVHFINWSIFSVMLVVRLCRWLLAGQFHTVVHSSDLPGSFTQSFILQTCRTVSHSRSFFRLAGQFHTVVHSSDLLDQFHTVVHSSDLPDSFTQSFILQTCRTVSHSRSFFRLAGQFHTVVHSLDLPDSFTRSFILQTCCISFIQSFILQTCRTVSHSRSFYQTCLTVSHSRPFFRLAGSVSHSRSFFRLAKRWLLFRSVGCNFKRKTRFFFFFFCAFWGVGWGWTIHRSGVNAALFGCYLAGATWNCCILARSVYRATMHQFTLWRCVHNCMSQFGNCVVIH